MYLSLSCLSSLPPDTKDVSHQRAASTRGQDDTPTLLSAPLSFKENTTATDTKLMDLMWGKDKVRQARNVQVRFCLYVIFIFFVLVELMIMLGNACLICVEYVYDCEDAWQR